MSLLPVVVQTIHKSRNNRAMLDCEGPSGHVSKSRCNRSRTRRKRRQRTRRLKNRAVMCDGTPVHVLLSQWMKHNTAGYRWRSTTLPAYFPDTGRGLMTTVPLSAGDTVISIPKNLLITQDTVIASEIGVIIKKYSFFSPLLFQYQYDNDISGCKFPRQQLICLFLLFEYHKGRDSFWFPYISVLPQVYTTPAYFTTEEINMLPKRLQCRAEKDRKKLSTVFNQLSDFCAKWWTEMADIINFDLFKWSWYSINSRSVYFKAKSSPYIVEDENHIAMAPYLDLLNHLHSAQIQAGYNPVTKHYEIKTYDSYKKYDQVFISYGPHDNHHLLLEYGFTLPENPHDAFEIDYDDLMCVINHMNLCDVELKTEIIRTHSLALKLACNMDGLSWSSLVTLRIFAMPWSELKDWKKALSGEKISNDNEKCVKQIASIVIGKYMTENATLLSKFPHESTQSEHQQIIYTIVKTDHDILQATMKFVTAM